MEKEGGVQHTSLTIKRWKTNVPFNKILKTRKNDGRSILKMMPLRSIFLKKYKYFIKYSIRNIDMSATAWFLNWFQLNMSLNHFFLSLHFVFKFVVEMQRNHFWKDIL